MRRIYFGLGSTGARVTLTRPAVVTLPGACGHVEYCYVLLQRLSSISDPSWNECLDHYHELGSLPDGTLHTMFPCP